MPKFVHSALQDPRKQIRLLSLNADADPVNLRCSLSTHDLHNAPEFIALSYECGSPDSAVDIIVNGRAYTIRHNLALLLTHIQRRPQCLDAIADELLWVDAICISQTNLDERHAQVAIMGTIYQAAARTYAWLGWPHQFDPYLVYNLMMDAASPANQDSIAQYSAAISSNKMLMGTGTIELLSQVLKWCSSSYFNRRWVVQELFLSKMVILVCGESAIRMPLIKPFMRVISTMSSKHTLFHLPVAESIHNTLPYRMFEFLDLYAHKPASRYEESLAEAYSSETAFLPPSASLYAVLQAFENTQCERIHDQLYAVLNLVKGCERIPVDYLLRPEQLLCQVLLQGGWSDVTSIKATAKVLGLGNSTLLQALTAGRVIEAPDSELGSHPLLLVENLTSLGRIQTIIKIPKESRRIWRRSHSKEDNVSSDISRTRLHQRQERDLEIDLESILDSDTRSWASQDSSRQDHKPDGDDLVVYVSDRGHVGACKNAEEGDILCSLHDMRRRRIILREQKQQAQGQNYFRAVAGACPDDMFFSREHWSASYRLHASSRSSAHYAGLGDMNLGEHDSEVMDQEERKALMLRQGVLLQIIGAKMQASATEDEKHDDETFDAKIDVWDWIDYACLGEMRTERNLES